MANTIDVRNLIRSFVMDEDTVTLNEKLYDMSREWFVMSTYGLLSCDDPYGAQHFTIMEDDGDVRSKLHSLGYIEWDEGTHSYMFKGYRMEFEKYAELALQYASYIGINNVPEAIHFSDEEVVVLFHGNHLRVYFTELDAWQEKALDLAEQVSGM